MTDEEINRRALAHGRNALRAAAHKRFSSEANPGTYWPGWLEAGLTSSAVYGDGRPTTENLAALDLACVMYAQMEEEATR